MAKFSRGDRVRVKANPERVGLINEVYDGDEPQYDVFFNALESRVFVEHALVGYDELGAAAGPVDLLKQWRLGDLDSFRGFLTLAKLRTPVADNLYSFLASRTELLPYQFMPVLKLIDSPHQRILIADEVGLGKTIEAGIALMEMNARSPLRRVLVTCPSALLGKWRSELRERFEWDFEILDGTRFRELIDEVAAYPDQPFRAIGSLELLRRAENNQLLAERRPALDAVIVDEAHHMRNHGTMTNLLGDTLSGLAETMIFLTATPLNLGERDFFELMRLLVPDEFHEFETFQSLIEPNEHINAALRIMRAGPSPDYRAALADLRRVERTSQARRFSHLVGYQEAVALMRSGREGPGDRELNVRIQRRLIELNTLSHVFTRTKKQEVSEYFPTRRAHKVSVDYTAEEREFYEAVTDWVVQTYSRVPLGFIIVTFQRQVASCIPAMKAKLEESVLNSAIGFSDEELTDLMGGDYAGEDSVSLELNDDRRNALQRLAEAARDVGERDSKFDRFLEALTGAIEEGAEKVLVFSFFVKTIQYLEGRLSNLTIAGRPLEVLKLFGPTPRDERRAVMNRFRTGTEIQVLLSSEVGSEGLDFQFCSTMFNYDLPWNPMRVEQRIGRLDRYGQEAEVIQIFNMVVADTIEDRIFYRLYERIGIFEKAIGDLEAILGDELRELQRDIFLRSLSREEEDRRSNAIANAIIRMQHDHEEFDEESRRFLGLDEVFVDRFNDIAEGRRYITSDELRNFVEAFLGLRFPAVALRPIDDAPDTYELVDADDLAFQRFLTDAYYQDPERSKLHLQFVARLGSGDPCLLTFEARRAAQDRTLEFLSIHHPLLRSVVLAGGLEVDLQPTGVLAIDKSSGDTWFFFVFELGIKSIRDEVEFITAVVGSDGAVDEAMSADFTRLVADSREVSFDATGVVTDVRVDEALDAARSWAGRKAMERTEELERLRDEAVDAQVESLRQSHERRVLRVSEQLEEAERKRQDQIARMRRGQRTNMIQRYEERVRALEAGKGVEVGHRIVAAGVLIGDGTGPAPVEPGRSITSV